MLTFLFNKYIISCFLVTFFFVHMYLSFMLVNPNPKMSSIISLEAFFIFFVSVLVHEFGHATALNRYGLRSGHIGFGLYLIFPTLFADVSKSWVLSSQNRVLVDLGGIYFQLIFLLLLDVYVILTGSGAGYGAIFLIIFAILYNLNPALKFDGYWLIVDLFGLDNLHLRVNNYFVSIFRSNGKSRNFKYHLAMLSYAFLYLSFILFILYTCLTNIPLSLNVPLNFYNNLVGKNIMYPELGRQLVDSLFLIVYCLFIIFMGFKLIKFVHRVIIFKD